MDELKHHGVPGMKWGVRKKQASSGEANPGTVKKEKKTSNTKAKIVKGAKIVGTLLAVIGGAAVATYAVNKAHALGVRDGILREKASARRKRSIAGVKGAVTRSVRKQVATERAKNATRDLLAQIGKTPMRNFAS